MELSNEAGAGAGVFDGLPHRISIGESIAELMPTPKGLTLLMAAAFLAGEMAGSGVLALPRAVLDSGWIGIALIILCCVNSGYTGSRLGECWLIVEERFPEYVGNCRSPYPTIAFRAFGNKTKILVAVCLTVTLFGTATVFLLLIAQLVEGLIAGQITISYCYWILVVGGLLIPFSWFGTPKDFWLVGIAALASTSIACFVIFVQIVIDGVNTKSQIETKLDPVTFKSFAFAFGTILFAFGGAATFPTIQNDMKERRLFKKSIVVTFAILLLLYLPVASSSYYVYGNNIKDNIIRNLNSGVPKIIVQSLMVVHLFFAFIVILNPFCQELEERLHLPVVFHWKRCVFRGSIILAIIFTALTIPHFGNILALVGGSTITLLTFVFPPLFYIRLCDHSNRNGWPKRSISLHERIYLYELIAIGLLGGVSSTWSAVSTIFSSVVFSVPCYVNPNSQCYINVTANC